MSAAIQMLVFIPLTGYAITYVLLRSELRDVIPLLVDAFRSGDRDRIVDELRFAVSLGSTCPTCRLWWVLLAVELFTTVMGGSFDVFRLGGTYGLFIATGDLAERFFGDPETTVTTGEEGNPWPS